MNVYIDTNILLSFFHLTSEVLGELDKLVALLNQKKITLLLPRQTADEFYRNREIKIADAIRRFKEQKLNLQFPAMCKDYETYTALRELQKKYEQHHAELLDQMLKDIDAQKLKADTLITRLFKFGHFDRAFKRNCPRCRIPYGCRKSARQGGLRRRH